MGTGFRYRKITRLKHGRSTAVIPYSNDKKDKLFRPVIGIPVHICKTEGMIRKKTTKKEYYSNTVRE